MGVIRELPPSVINQIAAGEVVERPASVAKELLENAIDAGARRVEITVERGGKDLVRVADDGLGMDPEDLPLAFRPHATSKLATAEDLHRVRTLGFRGEALAAIAEVSRVRCQSRTASAESGSELAIEGGIVGSIRPCGVPVGTVIEVRNLFFNTPVRRAFLKSDTTESGHVVEAFQRIALAHPDVHLSYRSGGKVLYDLPPVAGFKERVAAFFGRELADNLLWVESTVDGVHLNGYVAHPSQSRSTAKGQYLFIGDRYVRDRSLGHALSEAYRGLLMVGRLPVAFLHLDIPPEDVDVNVHPSKIEVRFRDGQRIYSQLLATVRETFLSSDLHTRLQPVPASGGASATAAADRGPFPSADPVDVTAGFGLATADDARQAVASWFAPTAPPSPPSPEWMRSPFESRPLPITPDGSQFPRVPPPATPADHFDEFASETRETSGTPEEPPPPSRNSTVPDRPVRALQIHDSYLVVETDEGMVVIDQHALHERILFEEFRDRVGQGSLESQRLLMAEPLDLSPAEAGALREHREALSALGLEIEPADDGTVRLASVPVLLRDAPAEAIVRDLAEHFLTRDLPPGRDALLQDLLSLMACKAAVKAGQRLGPEEIAALLERRHLAHDAHHCPHGRPTALTLTKSELERQFGRI